MSLKILHILHFRLHFKKYFSNSFKCGLKCVMANLPFYRVNDSRSFSHVGVDFAGPFTIESSHLKVSLLKGFFCLFMFFCKGGLC